MKALVLREALSHQLFGNFSLFSLFNFIFLWGGRDHLNISDAGVRA